MRVLLQPLGSARHARPNAVPPVYDDWRGYLIAGFALVWVANHYMSLFGRLRLGIKSERIDVSLKEELRDKVSNA